MAVIGTAEEMAVGRAAKRGEDGLREYSRTFRVITSDPTDDANIVMAASGLPQMYDPYTSDTSEDPEARVIDMDPRQHDKLRTLWIVVVTYSTDWGDDGGQGGQEDSPFAEPPVIHFSSEIFQEPLPGQCKSEIGSAGDPSNDLTSSTPRNNQSLINWSAGAGICNSAGQPYNPPPERQSSRPIVTFTRNEPSFSTANKVLYENTVNKDAWCGLQPRQAWLRSIEAESLIWRTALFSNAEYLYWRITYTFALKYETWDLQVLDYGPYYLTWSGNGISAGEVPKISDFETADKSPRFGLLDNSDPNKPGRKLANGQPPQWRRFLIYREQPFSGLAINLNLALENIKKRVRGKTKE